MTSAREATGYLLSNLNPSGRFNYRTYLGEEVDADNKTYNILRHSGTIYALGQYAELAGDVDWADQLVLAGDYLKSCCRKPLSPADPDKVAIWSLGAVNGGRRAPRAKLGGTALGLLAFLAIEEQRPGYVSDRELKTLANTICAMQKPDGDFNSVYQSATQGFDPNFKSLFYPGEAILALFRLYRFDGNEEWLRAGLRGLRYICQSRSDLPLREIPSDHWALLATAELFANVRPGYYEEDKPLFTEHARRVIEGMLDRQRLSDGDGLYYGSFNASGTTTPVGTKLEGMIAVGPYLDVPPEFLERMKASCRIALTYLQDARVRSGAYRGGVTYLPAAVRESRKPPKRVHGKIQIDNVQHVMSGWIWSVRHREWLYGE